MAKKKIIFFINAITITRCIKRIEEYIDNGYEVEAYGFERGGEVYAQPSKFHINVIGKHDVSQGYFTRLRIIFSSLKPILKKYRKEDVIFYYFFFDIAFTARLLSRKPFIYEESDIPYTGVGNVWLRNLLRRIDKRIIRKSLLTVMTSEGFIDYHFGDERPKNIIVVPNRVNPQLDAFEYHNKVLDINHLSFAFVGGFRYDSIMNFATVVAERFPQHDFHVFGNIMQNEEALMSLVEKHDNIRYHGLFRNPDDLPGVYEKIDVVLATYDATSINAQYAEPNKLYEAIYFRTPIVVSSNTFLAKKVKRLGIGYDINGLNKDEIVAFIENLSQDDLLAKQSACAAIPKETATNSNPEVFDYLNTIN